MFVLTNRREIIKKLILCLCSTCADDFYGMDACYFHRIATHQTSKIHRNLVELRWIFLLCKRLHYDILIWKVMICPLNLLAGMILRLS